MTFKEAIDSLTKEQVLEWWAAKVYQVEAPETEIKNNWKYYLEYNGNKWPFKYAVRQLFEYFKLDVPDFGSDTDTRALVCEKFGFTIEEDLVFDEPDKARFVKFYTSKIKNKEIFEQFIKLVRYRLRGQGISSYYTRFSLRPNDILVVIGMRAVLSYQEVEGKSIIGFIIDKDKLDEVRENHKSGLGLNKYEFVVHKEIPFQGTDNNTFVELVVKDNSKDIIDDLDEEVLQDNGLQIVTMYDAVRNNKMAQWNIEAKTTNDTLKYLVYEYINLEDWIQNNKIHYNSLFNVVEKLKLKINESQSVLDHFTFRDMSPNARFVWIRDHLNLIGEKEAHYEIIARKKQVYLELHFEGKPVATRNRFNQQIKTLPNTLKWIEWDKAKSIGCVENKNINDSDIVDWLYNQLLMMETEIGDKVREIIKTNTIQNNNESKMTNKNALNTILFGPPGTGKTYNMINKALEKLGQVTNGLTRNELLRLFDQKVAEGRIVFTTFHQSMSYEDFIEGIKPKTINGEIRYEVLDGIFKRLSYVAQFAHLKNDEQAAIERFVDFDTLYDQYIESLENRINSLSETESLKLPLRTKGFFTLVLSIDTEDNYLVTRGGKASTDAKVRKENLRLLYNKFKTVDEIVDVSNDIRSVGPGLGWSSNYFGVFKDLKLFENNQNHSIAPARSMNIDYNNYSKIREILSISEKNEFKSNPDNFVLIIDEINRGNVSAIFGELITLIEDDKRLGNKEATRVTLPYSKESFGVPNNLYLIGTMNTADRSVESLDSALRRRFSFEEMRPKPALLAELSAKATNVSGIDLVQLLTTINERIELLLDKDHQIGHSYFIGVESLENLRHAFANKVIPLLEEYFFGDFGKIGLVLGGKFIQEVKNTDKVQFASNFKYEDENLLREKAVYKFTPADDSTAESFISIYTHTKND